MSLPLFGGTPSTTSVLDDPEPRTSLPLWDDSYGGTIPGFEAPMAPDPSCRRCTLSSLRRHVKHVCQPAHGEPGGVLVVMESPTQGDDAHGHRFDTSTGVNKIVASLVAPFTEALGPARYTWALRCPGRKVVTPEEIAACRPYLAHEFDLKPKAALIFGPAAALACTGAFLDARSLRRGWSLVRGVPSFFLPPLYLAALNKFWKQRLKADVAWALTETPPAASLRGDVRVGLDPASARALLAQFRAGEPLAYDTEHWPQDPWFPDSPKGRFTLLSIGLYQPGVGAVVIPGEVALDCRAALARLLADPATPKYVANGKHDRHVVWRALGFDVRGVDWDVGVVAQLIASEDRKGLGPLAWQVGLGGLKALGQVEDEDE